MSGGIGRTESKSVVRRARYRRETETYSAPYEHNARASADAKTEERR